MTVSALEQSAEQQCFLPGVSAIGNNSELLASLGKIMAFDAKLAAEFDRACLAKTGAPRAHPGIIAVLTTFPNSGTTLTQALVHAFTRTRSLVICPTIGPLPSMQEGKRRIITFKGGLLIANISPNETSLEDLPWSQRNRNIAPLVKTHRVDDLTRHAGSMGGVVYLRRNLLDNIAACRRYAARKPWIDVSGFGIERLISAYLEHLSALRSALALRGGGESRWPVFCTTYEHLTVRPRSESAALLQIEFLGHIADPAALNLSAVEVRASARTANCGADEIVPGHLGACEFAPHLLAKLANAIHRYHPTG